MLHGIFDSHAHYDDARFDQDRHPLIAALPDRGVSAVLNAASDLDSAAKAQALAKQYPYFWCAAGVHPHEAQGLPQDYLDRLVEYLAYEKCVAVGEIGLDYHYDFSEREVQREIFRQQMDLAVQIGKPVIIHSREAVEDTLRILRQFPKATGVVHCFSGSAETAAQLLRMGYYIGFTGVVTFHNARKVAEAAKAVPSDRILVETDCPYMAPVPCRGKRCDSTLLPYTIEALANMRQADAQQLTEQAANNTRALFGIAQK